MDKVTVLYGSIAVLGTPPLSAGTVSRREG